MEKSPPPDKMAAALAQRATAFAEAMARQELKSDILCETVGHDVHWMEFRQLFKQHMRIWQRMTTVTLVAAADGVLLGWLVEGRKAKCAAPVLSDADIETCARRIGQLDRNFRLTGIRRLPLGEQRSMAVASFASLQRNDVREVSINPSTGEIIGFLPIPTGKVAPLAISEPDADKAMEMAWQQVEADLNVRLGAEAITQLRDAFKLTPLSLTRDEGQRSFWVFNLWHYFTTCDVAIDRASQEVVGWYIEALQSDAPDRIVDKSAAIKTAQVELKASVGVTGPKVTFERVGDAEKATVYWWHAEGGINFEGDHTTVLLNSTTGRPYSVWRKWRTVPAELLKQTAIDSKEAIQAADRVIKRASTDSPGQVIGKFVIELADADKPGPVQNALVWRVGYSKLGEAGFTEVAIDCRTGDAVRVTGW